MLDLFIYAWFVNNWEIIVAVTITIFLIKNLISFNESFDNDPSFSIEEKVRTFFNGAIMLFCLIFVVSMLISYYN